MGVGEKFQVAPLGNPFCTKSWHYIDPETALVPFSGGISDARPKTVLNTHTIRAVCVFLILRKPESLVGPMFSQINKLEGESGRSLFLRLRNHRGQIRILWRSFSFHAGASSSPASGTTRESVSLSLSRTSPPPVRGPQNIGGNGGADAVLRNMPLISFRHKTPGQARLGVTR